MASTSPPRVLAKKRAARSHRWFLAAALLVTGGFAIAGALRSDSRSARGETCWLELGVRIPVGDRQHPWSGFVVLRGRCLHAEVRSSASEPSDLGDGAAAPAGSLPEPGSSVGRP